MQKMIESLYTIAHMLTESTGIQHHVDHIQPLQGKKVSGLHVQDNLQVVTAEDNIRKKNRNKWIPHKAGFVRMTVKKKGLPKKTDPRERMKSLTEVQDEEEVKNPVQQATNNQSLQPKEFFHVGQHYLSPRNSRPFTECTMLFN